MYTVLTLFVMPVLNLFITKMKLILNSYITLMHDEKVLVIQSKIPLKKMPIMQLRKI